MKIEELKDCVEGDTFRIAGKLFTVDKGGTTATSNDGYCTNLGSSKYVSGWLVGMEVTDVVRKRERVTLTFEVLRDGDCVEDFDVGDTGYRLHDLRESGEIGYTAEKACAHGGFSRILRPVKT